MQSIEAVFKTQQARSLVLRNSSAKERRLKLQLLLKNFLEMEDEVLSALSSDLGRALWGSLLSPRTVNVDPSRELQVLYFATL